MSLKIFQDAYDLSLLYKNRTQNMVKKFLIIAASLIQIFALSCLDINGNPVAWWNLVKMPKAVKNAPFYGKSYLYVSPDNPTPTLSTNPINVTSPMTYTLNQLNTDKTVSFLFYNDGYPGSETNYSSYYGHSKGILAYTQTQAIYIIHSVPHFPYTDNVTNAVVLDIADPQTMYGQNMMCIQLDPQTLFNIAGIMTINHPAVYFSRIVNQNANITYLVKNVTAGYKFTQSIYSFTSNGNFYTYFAKDMAGQWDLYEDIIAPYYNDGFKVESWGRPYDASFCKPKYSYNVLNVLGVNLGRYAWYNTDDHSKWGIAIKNTNIYCSSDINRMNSQRKRGGGALCTNSTLLYTAFSSLITLEESCNELLSQTLSYITS
ncbi:DNASE2B_1 [Blepharisma stoltei]|uniref:Uncharacterized protein n=1 Tax=Blepharisma stoltei TaxID=1481888 RepID=A0AAU9K4W7_9CILI|nr:unnamed protein product [Blepharisma stoltei]